jgi:phage terminase Nu1 subunit (DNA packaging protein)
MTKLSKSSKLPPTSAAQLASLAGVTAEHINKLARDGIVPKARRGQFDTEAAIRALVQYYRQGREGSTTYAEQKLEHVRAQTEDVRQRTAIRSGRHVPLEEVRTAFDATLNIFSASMDGLGGRVANELAPEPNPAVIKGKIDEETRRILQSASASLAAYADDQEGGAGAAPRGCTGRGRVGE